MSAMNVSAADICFWTLDSENSHQAIALYSVLDSIPDERRVRARLEEASRQFTKLLARRSEKPSSQWEVVDRLDLDYHLQYRSTEADVKAAAEAEFSTPLDLQKPLWKIRILSSPDQRQVGLLYVVHHSFADGLSGMALFYSLCDEVQESDTPPPAHTVKTFRPRKTADSRNFLASASRLLRDGLKRPSQSSLKGKTSAKRKFETLKLPLHTVNQLRRKEKLSMNEWYLHLITEALRDYFQALGEPSNPVAALIPVNLRQNDTVEQLGNQLSAVRIELPCQYANLKQRIKRLTQELERIKHDGSYGSYALLSGVLAKLPWSIRVKALRFAARRIDCICTNAPGPKQARFFAGSRIESTWGLPALMHSQGLGFAAVRYHGYLHISLVYDPTVLKDAKLLTKKLHAYLLSEPQQNAGENRQNA